LYTDRKSAFDGAAGVSISMEERRGGYLSSDTSSAIASLGLACLSLLIGVWASLPAGIPWRQIVFSYLMSRGHNPNGHFYAAAGLAVSTFFLFPVARRLRDAFPATRMTRVAAVLSVIGIGCLTFMGTLARVIDRLGSFHDDVTALSLFSIMTSMFLYLLQIAIRGRGWPRALAAAMIFPLVGSIAYLVDVFSKPLLVDSDKKLWHSLAALEWSAVSFIAVCLFVLLLLGGYCGRHQARWARC
jgi:high-affinity nickel permease